MREYESDKSPENGDEQILFPIQTSATAASIAALAQASSSPGFKEAFPKAANAFKWKAQEGWKFLKTAWKKHGYDGSYQKIGHWGDLFMHDDEIVWALTELYLATLDDDFHNFLLEQFNPNDPETRRWKWVKLYEGYGAAIRSYRFAVSSGRISKDRMNQEHFAACEQEILDWADDIVRWGNGCSYGTSFPYPSKRHKSAGWYFPAEYAFDLVTAQQLDSRREFQESLLRNMYYETGVNPANICYVTGLGSSEIHEVVSQFFLERSASSCTNRDSRWFDDRRLCLSSDTWLPSCRIVLAPR